MASFEVVWKRSAEKELRQMPRALIRRIVDAVIALKDDPFPPGVRKLQGAERTYRIRVGDYRVVYTVDGGRLVIEVIRVRHRREVYR
jgi:mRNA interferase RelE/StbE